MDNVNVFFQNTIQKEAFAMKDKFVTLILELCYNDLEQSIYNCELASKDYLLSLFLDHFKKKLSQFYPSFLYFSQLKAVNISNILPIFPIATNL